MFSACVLCYGDSTAEAARCLGSLLFTLKDLTYVADLRIGLNEVSPAVANIVTTAANCFEAFGLPVHVYQELQNKNVWKYPLMRRMLYDPEHPPAARVMWFDDDSYIRSYNPSFWANAYSAASRFDLVGSRYSIQLKTAQLKAAFQQPWWAERELPVISHRSGSVWFVTGGWWMADTAKLKRWDYPFPAIKHNGGDSMLGLLALQQRWRLLDWKEGVAINADALGGESRAKRRGATTRWPWEDNDNTDHQDFMTKVTRYLCNSKPTVSTLRRV